MEENVTPEWSHMIAADEVIAKPLKLTLSPNQQEITDLKRRLNILSLDSFTAALVLRREEGGLVINIRGHIKAKIRQSCVVSLEPVDSDIDERFEAWFADKEQAITLARAKHDKDIKAGSETPILEEKDDPEAILNGQIDLGELVTQHLSLAINPYPHQDGVHYEYGDDEPEKVPEAFKTNPFAALKDWKSKLED